MLDSSRRTIKTYHFSWVRDIQWTFIAMGLKIFCICSKIDVLEILREVKRPLRIVLCMESPYNLINVLGLFQSLCNHKIFAKLNLPILLVLVKSEKNHKNDAFLWFSLKFKSFKSTKFSWCYEFSKVGTFLWLTCTFY